MSLRKTHFIFLVLLFALVPFNAFLVNALTGLFDLEAMGRLLLAAWKEIVLFILLIITSGLAITKKIDIKKLDTLDVFIVLYIVWALITGFVRWETDILRIIWGAKYSLAFLVLFLCVRHVDMGKEKKWRLLQIVLASGAVVVFFGALQKFLPPDFLTLFGYTTEFSSFDPQGATSYCQKISFTETCRLQSFLSGPNQFSAYLLIVLPLFFFLAEQHFRRKKEIRKNAPLRAFGATFFLLALFCLFFAYSRAAWGGFLVAFTVAFFLLFRQQRWFRWLFASGIVAVILVIAGTLMTVPRPYGETCIQFDTMEQNTLVEEYGIVTRFFCKVVFRPSSSQGHFERSSDGIDHILMHPLGTGLGDSGPASARFYENGIGFIPESWYLQVGIDTGWPGLILFFGILFLTGKRLLETKTWQGQALCCALIGICIMSLKQHAWESASVALTFWGLAGVVLAKKRKEGKWITRAWRFLRRKIFLRS